VATELRALYGRIEALPSRERVALVLRRVEGLGIDEIAALVGASPATVKRRIADGEQRLAKFNGAEPEERASVALPPSPSEGRPERHGGRPRHASSERRLDS
jgi:DNA-directed RNA polymerase specialized sigma24 family protein